MQEEEDEVLARIHKFHAHLDVCEQCERHPFDLCPEGAKLLREAALGPAENQPVAKFSMGDRVKIVRLLDIMTSRELIGKIGTIREIDPLPNGEFNYYVDGHYMHEAELEREEIINDIRTTHPEDV